MANKTICVSGGFDPVHCGHVDLFEEAARHGDLIVILNSDDWLIGKKGYAFMTWAARAKIIKALMCVKEVVSVHDEDGTVCEALERIKPDYFANGGDRKKDNTPELDICKKLGIIPLFGIGGEKTQSSSELVNALVNK